REVAADTGAGLAEAGWQVCAKLQSVFRGKPAHGVRVDVIVAAGDGAGAWLLALSGLLKSAQREQPGLVFQIIELDRAGDPAAWPTAWIDAVAAGASLHDQ